jgi:hypothetical protein
MSRVSSGLGGLPLAGVEATEADVPAVDTADEAAAPALPKPLVEAAGGCAAGAEEPGSQERLRRVCVMEPAGRRGRAHEGGGGRRKDQCFKGPGKTLLWGRDGTKAAGSKTKKRIGVYGSLMQDPWDSIGRWQECRVPPHVLRECGMPMARCGEIIPLALWPGPDGMKLSSYCDIRSTSRPSLATWKAEGGGRRVLGSETGSGRDNVFLHCRPHANHQGASI